MNGAFLEGVVGAAGSHCAELREESVKPCYARLPETPSNSPLTAAIRARQDGRPRLILS